ncbi:MAG: hypothetical protein GXY83_28705 [Rhodopirellula sp.]|nr:hypothetical protein [Rhodopirellula sp.]
MPLAPDLQLDASVLRRRATGLIVAGLAALALGAAFSAERLWGNLLLASVMLAGLGLGGAFFLALHGVTGARWSTPLLPAAYRLAGTLPWTAAAAGAVAVAGLFFYPWTHGEAAHGATFWFKNAWLSLGFFVARTVAYVVFWAMVARSLVSTRSPAGVGRSALALVVLGLSVSAAGFDWIMSLEPLWFSTMFGVYQFAGIFVSALAALVVLTAWLKRTGAGCADAGENQLHDLGKLLFGFSCFWMYIWFSQYMLIWYVNITEESVYFIRRMQGLWQPVTLLSLGLNWAIPFFVLLPRPAKRNWRVMVRISLVILAGRWLDLYLMILPPLAGTYPAYGFAELGGLLLVAGLLLRFVTAGPCQVSAALSNLHPEAAPTA